MINNITRRTNNFSSVCWFLSMGGPMPSASSITYCNVDSLIYLMKSWWKKKNTLEVLENSLWIRTTKWMGKSATLHWFIHSFIHYFRCSSCSPTCSRHVLHAFMGRFFFPFSPDRQMCVRCNLIIRLAHSDISLEQLEMYFIKLRAF